MKLGIMQPYFFPYLGYFCLIKHVDLFILLDEVQFIRHGWIERNRIMHPSDGWLYIRVPLNKHNQETKIRDIYINNTENWKQRIFAQLAHYKKIAPFYPDVTRLLEEIFSVDYYDLSHLNKASLKCVCDYLNISTPIKIFSEMELTIEKVSYPDDWALNICKALAANEYWNPPGGKSLFDIQKYRNNDVSIKFVNISLTPYFQGSKNFVEGLSIIDVLMFNSREDVIGMLDRFSLI